ncbi:MAG TPA: DUF5916 domain-containing protein [Gemmatimonadaceae bacterium]|jgi:hypothetical protein
MLSFLPLVSLLALGTQRDTARVPAATVAIRARRPPVIDGRDNDPVWREAPPIIDFTEWQPTEGKQPRFKTEAKVAYDAANLYVFVRAYDPRPDSIARILERRDTFTPTDKIWIFLDSYHDKRTGYEFGVTPAGVKLDGQISNGGNEDFAWDAVWDVATTVDSLGWTAEFRIPLSQLRYGKQRRHDFGFTIDRDIYRYTERMSWPQFSQAKPDMISQLGTLEDLEDLEVPRRLEAIPYVVTKRASTITNNLYTNPSSASAGGDIKYRVAPNMTLDATINPDFGQVESDPAVLNLSAYESFFDERRPFFVAGRGVFSFPVNCSNVNCSSENLYYSRRIGRTPQLAPTYGDTVPQAPTTILGAAKLSGRLTSGTTIGVLDAVTQRDASPGDTTFEPRTNYGVVRATQDFRGGNSTIGGMLTAVDRANDSWTAGYLPTNAYVGAVDFRHRFFKNTYEISGSFDESRVQGTPQAMAALQTDAVHYYQRPDAGLPLDSTRTVLGGDAEELHFSKVSGRHLSFESALQRRSPGFEINDLGYLRRADQTSWNTWVGYFDRNERFFYQRFQWNNNWWQYWTTNGLALEAAYNTNFQITLKNNWGVHFGSTLGQLGSTYDDRSARGGPAIRQDTYNAPWVFINGDDRRAVVPYLSWSFYNVGNGKNRSWNVGPEIDYKSSGRFSSAFSLNFSKNIDDDQWFGFYADASGPHYTFARLNQTTTSATVRLNYTFTPAVSLQAYVQPFVSKGAYVNVRQLSSTPRAIDYDARFAPFIDPSVTGDPGGFNFKEFQSNLVFRWEYRPGSTLFVVWNEGRQGYANQEGNTPFTGDIRNLMSLHPANTILVKMSYWLNR